MNKEDRDFLNNLIVEINDPRTGKNFILKGYKQILKFCEREKAYWEKLENRTNIITSWIQHYNNRISQLEVFNTNFENWDENTRTSQWQSLLNTLKSRHSDPGSFKLYYSNTPISKFLSDIYVDNPTDGDQAYNYFSDVQLNTNNRQSLNVFIKCYEFEMQSDTLIRKRRDSERRTLSSIANEWEQKTQDLHHEFDTQKAAFTDWKDNFTEGHEGWQNEIKSSLDDFIQDRKEKLSEFEELYQEKLKLEAPAKYWSDRAVTYRKRGWMWLGALSALVVGFIVFLKEILYNPPDSFSAKLFEGDPLAVKSIIIVATIISFSAYLARVLSKLTFSSFHIERDAEEREQLTYVYLALIKDSAVEEKDRHIILQSLFSRVETGLLGNDSSPAMPGIGQIIDKATNG